MLIAIAKRFRPRRGRPVSIDPGWLDPVGGRRRIAVSVQAEIDGRKHLRGGGNVIEKLADPANLQFRGIEQIVVAHFQEFDVGLCRKPMEQSVEVD